MAEEEHYPKSLAERMAALNMAQIGKMAPPSYTQPPVNRQRPPPPPPPVRPALPARPQSTNVPPTNGIVASIHNIGNVPEEPPPDYVTTMSNGTKARPALPVRPDSQASQKSAGPTLPPRRPSGQPALPARRTSEAPSIPDSDRTRRLSIESTSSAGTFQSSTSGISNFTSRTTGSNGQRVKAPDYDPTGLPVLPPNRTKEEKEADARRYAGLRPVRQMKSTPRIQQPSEGTTPPPSTRSSIIPPPALPSRSNIINEESEPVVAPSRAQPTLPARPRQSALLGGFGQSATTPLPNGRSASVPQLDSNAHGPPPPLPESRPDLTALLASKPKMNSASTSNPQSVPQSSCLHCRDFSAADNHAAQFPREQMRHNDVSQLAHQLTSPFPSATDKARAIFTWLHHNVAYDVDAFFNNNVQPSTPSKTMTTGLAVCEGYAGLFAALALAAGLEALVVSGACKGFGHSEMSSPHDPVPPYKMTHAWNAVRIDHGEWKLIDACWGAGVVQGAGKPYKKRFAPERFTQSNEAFGLDHFPGDPAQQFRVDGRPLGYEEYARGSKNGCGAQFYSGFVSEEGFLNTSYQPRAGKLVLSALAAQGPTVRFAFQRICPHWDPMRCGPGKPYVYVLHLDAWDGTPAGTQNRAFETNGEIWWCDVPVRELGRPGQHAQIWAVNSFDGRDGRGVSIDEYRRKNGRCGMGFGFVCKWEIV